jgi:hypothetical protein
VRGLTFIEEFFKRFFLGGFWDFFIMEGLEILLKGFGFDIEDSLDIVLPTQKRIEFQEMVLEIFEPGILRDPDLNLPGVTQIARLTTIYSDLGIPSSSEIIQGTCPQSTSISHLISLLMLLTPSFPLESLERNLNFISSNFSIFDKQTKLFLSNFPPKHSSSTSISQELQITLDYWSQEVKRVSSMAPKLQETDLPDQNLLKNYKNALENFIKSLKIFKKTYQEKIQMFMTEGVEKEDSIGKWSKVCVEEYEKIENMLKDVESIWESVNVLVNR